MEVTREGEPLAGSLPHGNPLKTPREWTSERQSALQISWLLKGSEVLPGQYEVTADPVIGHSR
ncbi:MAG: hypothetical protein Kow0063_35170 [Anaerolineae bacterium]